MIFEYWPRGDRRRSGAGPVGVSVGVAACADFGKSSQARRWNRTRSGLKIRWFSAMVRELAKSRPAAFSPLTSSEYVNFSGVYCDSDKDSRALWPVGFLLVFVCVVFLVLGARPPLFWFVLLVWDVKWLVDLGLRG